MTMQHTDYDDGTGLDVRRWRLHGRVDEAVKQMLWAGLVDATSEIYQQYRALSAAIEQRYSQTTRARLSLSEVTDEDIKALQAAARRVCQADELSSLLAALNANVVQWTLNSAPRGAEGPIWFTAELSSWRFDGVWLGHGQSEVAALRATLAELATFYRGNRAAWAASPVKQQEFAYVEQVLHDAQV